MERCFPRTPNLYIIMKISNIHIRISTCHRENLYRPQQNLDLSNYISTVHNKISIVHSIISGLFIIKSQLLTFWRKWHSWMNESFIFFLYLLNLIAELCNHAAGKYINSGHKVFRFLEYVRSKIYFTILRWQRYQNGYYILRTIFFFFFFFLLCQQWKIFLGQMTELSTFF